MRLTLTMGLLAACGGAASVPSTTSSLEVEATANVETTANVEPTSTEQLPSASSTSTTWVETEFVIHGDDAFVQHTEMALSLVEAAAPDLYNQVYVHIDTIEAVEAGSGMDVYTETFKVGEETAYAPGWPVADQLRWYASTIVHDACHSRLYDEGKEPGGRDAELECLMDQLAILQALEHPAFEGYISGWIEGVDDPGNDYWNDPNRHW